MIYYIADLHFGHENVIRFDNRPFSSSDEMDKIIIENWNKKVKPDDTVYILGDVSLGFRHKPEWYISQLAGHKILISGNHDGYILKNPETRKLFDEIYQILEVNDNGRRVVLCHYPLAEWPGYFRGVYHVYGHIHVQKNRAYEFMKDEPMALNAGCMINNYVPVSLDELISNNNIWFGRER